MADEERAGSATQDEREEALFEQIEKARVAREQATRVRGGRRLIVPFRDTIPSERVHR
jgi:hypothetical protein